MFTNITHPYKESILSSIFGSNEESKIEYFVDHNRGWIKGQNRSTCAFRMDKPRDFTLLFSKLTMEMSVFHSNLTNTSIKNLDTALTCLKFDYVTSAGFNYGHKRAPKNVDRVYQNFELYLTISNTIKNFRDVGLDPSTLRISTVNGQPKIEFVNENPEIVKKCIAVFITNVSNPKIINLMQFSDDFEYDLTAYKDMFQKTSQNVYEAYERTIVIRNKFKIIKDRIQSKELSKGEILALNFEILDLNKEFKDWAGCLQNQQVRHEVIDLFIELKILANDNESLVPHLNDTEQLLLAMDLSFWKDDFSKGKKTDAWDKIFDAYWKGLDTLNLSNLKLTELPYSICLLKKLTVLIISNNKIQTFPDSIKNLSIVN